MNKGKNNLLFLSSLIVVVFSFYQELKAKTIKDVGHNNEGLTEETTWSWSDLTIFFFTFIFGQYRYLKFLSNDKERTTN